MEENHTGFMFLPVCIPGAHTPYTSKTNHWSLWDINKEWRKQHPLGIQIITDFSKIKEEGKNYPKLAHNRTWFLPEVVRNHRALSAASQHCCEPGVMLQLWKAWLGHRNSAVLHAKLLPGGPTFCQIPKTGIIHFLWWERMWLLTLTDQFLCALPCSEYN